MTIQITLRLKSQSITYHICIVSMIKHIPRLFSEKKKIQLQVTGNKSSAILFAVPHATNDTNFRASLSSLLMYSGGSSSETAHSTCIPYPKNNSPQMSALRAIVCRKKNKTPLCVKISFSQWRAWSTEWSPSTINSSSLRQLHRRARGRRDPKQKPVPRAGGETPLA